MDNTPSAKDIRKQIRDEIEHELSLMIANAREDMDKALINVGPDEFPHDNTTYNCKVARWAEVMAVRIVVLARIDGLSLTKPRNSQRPYPPAEFVNGRLAFGYRGDTPEDTKEGNQ